MVLTSLELGIKEYLESNDSGSTESIAGAVGASYSSVIKCIKDLEAKGEIERVNKHAKRYVRWTLTGHASKMPFFKMPEGQYLPVIDIFRGYIKATRSNGKPAKTPVGRACLGICLAFVSAMNASLGPDKATKAAQALTLSRQEMIQALATAERQVEFIRAVLRDPKLNAERPRSLVPYLLHDEINTVELSEIMNDGEYLMDLLLANK